MVSPHANWTHFIQHFIYALHTAVHESIGKTPTDLFLGRKTRGWFFKGHEATVELNTSNKNTLEFTEFPLINGIDVFSSDVVYCGISELILTFSY